MITAMVLLRLLGCCCIFASLLSASEPVQSLFNGKDLTGWRRPVGEWFAVGSVSLNGSDPKKLTFTPGAGVLLNGRNGPTSDLITEAEYGDVELHVEFCLPKQSNSGVYLMGRYEVQIYDSFGVAKDEYPGIECGGIYPQWIEERNVGGHSPSVNVSKPAGEWQSFDITFRAPRFDAAGKKVENARFVRVAHNGKVIHQNVPVGGPTRAAHWEDEHARGPILLQGDHGPVAYRNLTIKPITP